MFFADASHWRDVILNSVNYTELADYLGIREADVRESQKTKGQIGLGACRGDQGLLLDAFLRYTPVTQAARACCLKYSIESQNYEESLYIMDNQVVQVERIEGGAYLQRTDKLGQMRQVCRSLAGKMKWNSKTPGKLPALLMSRQQFEEIARQSHELDLEDMIVALTNITNDTEGSIALAKCLKTCLSHGDIYFLTWNGTAWEQQKAQFIVNEHFNWLLRFSIRENEDWMIATPTPKEKLVEMLLMWLKK